MLAYAMFKCEVLVKKACCVHFQTRQLLTGKDFHDVCSALSPVIFYFVSYFLAETLCSSAFIRGLITFDDGTLN